MKGLAITLCSTLLGTAMVACSPGSSDPGAGSEPPPPSPGPSSPPPSTPPPPSSTGGIDPVNGFLTSGAPTTHSFVNDGASLIQVQIAPGTTAYSVSLPVAGQTRRYVVLRRDPAPANAPVLLLLHPSATSPEEMANLTEISDYVATQGFWAVLPEGTGETWDDDPASGSNKDVPFISALIDSLISQGVDGSRIYAAGFSNGGFMSERLACDLSTKIAAFGIDAATLRGTQAAACAPTNLRSKVYFLGTADAIVPYNGIFPASANGLGSADSTMAYWAAQQHCGGVIGSTLPNRANDGTTVQLDQYTGCSGGTALQRYTINGGGHAWPGGQPVPTGVSTQDIQASGLIWLFVRDARR